MIWLLQIIGRPSSTPHRWHSRAGGGAVHSSGGLPVASSSSRGIARATISDDVGSGAIGAVLPSELPLIPAILAALDIRQRELDHTWCDQQARTLDPIMVDAKSLATITTETVALVAGPFAATLASRPGLPRIADDLLQCPSWQSRRSCRLMPPPISNNGCARVESARDRGRCLIE
jgi:hypothetical protein